MKHWFSGPERRTSPGPPSSRGPLGFGKHSRLHSAKLLELSSDLPILVEIVDSEEKINAFLPTVDELVTEGLVTLEAVRILKYVAPEKAS